MSVINDEIEQNRWTVAQQVFEIWKTQFSKDAINTICRRIMELAERELPD
jgi:DNA-binding transcriptional regulator WhiA